MPPDEPAQAPPARTGFYSGEIAVPDDFDTMMADEIEEMLAGGPLVPSLSEVKPDEHETA